MSKYGSTTFGTVDRSWSGVSPEITIISTNGTSYNLKEDEIYFIDSITTNEM
jgi:hypothetical protein